MSDIAVREATAEDWPQIWPIYDAIVSAGETYTFPEGSEDEARAVWMERPPGRTVVAVEGDTVVGTAKYGPNRPGRGAHVSTASFMVSPAEHGRGVGRLLGEYVLERARAEGYRGMQFNAVVEVNEPAVRLWQSLGFEIVGTVPGAFHHARKGYVGLHVMYRPF
jgi:L-amino acid N-acyltransferase YncA